jgi:chemotaxis protein methyltransferase CheR
MELLLGFVQRRTGLAFPPNRRFAVWRAVPRLMERLGAADPAELLRLLEAEPELFAELVSALTVNESYFFRDPDQLRFLRNTVLPQVLAEAGEGRKAQLWSAGCANGEEPYTLAILLHQTGALARAEVLGSDVDQEALARARLGVYTAWSLRGMDEADVQRYFRQRGERYALEAEIRERVRFRALNLADPQPVPPESMDVVLCRNVLIYFEREMVERVVVSLLEALRPGGWLLLGGADPLVSEIVTCEVVNTGAGLAYRKLAPRAARPAHPAPAAPPRAVKGFAIAPEAPRPEPPRAAESRLEAVVGTAAQPQNATPPEAAWVERVRALLAEGRRSEAQARCVAGLELHPASAELLYLNALLLSESGHDAEAASAARRALYLDRRLGVAHLAFGQSMLRLGERERAARSFRAAETALLALGPEAPVPAAGDVDPQSLLALVREQLRLLSGVR